jgi:hypothetical protein
MGKTDHEDLIGYYKSADILIHTPDKERRSEKIVIIDKNRGGALGEALVTDHFKCGAWKSRSVSDPHSGISF